MKVHVLVVGVSQSTINKGTKDEFVLTELRVKDWSADKELRSAGEFVVYLSNEQRMRLPQGDLELQKLTVVAREIGISGKAIKLKGPTFAGHLTTEEVQKRLEKEKEAAPLEYGPAGGAPVSHPGPAAKAPALAGKP